MRCARFDWLTQSPTNSPCHAASMTSCPDQHARRRRQGHRQSSLTRLTSRRLNGSSCLPAYARLAPVTRRSSLSPNDVATRRSPRRATTPFTSRKPLQMPDKSLWAPRRGACPCPIRRLSTMSAKNHSEYMRPASWPSTRHRVVREPGAPQCRRERYPAGVRPGRCNAGVTVQTTWSPMKIASPKSPRRSMTTLPLLVEDQLEVVEPIASKKG